MKIRFYVDPETGAPHVHNHEVDEVADVLSTPGEDCLRRDGSRVAIGRTRSGRHLKVIYVPDPQPASVFVITGYEVAGKALLAYRRRRKRKGK